MRLLKEIFIHWKNRIGWYRAIYAFLAAMTIGNFFGFLLTWLFSGAPQPVAQAMVLGSMESFAAYLAVCLGWEQGLNALRHAHCI